MKILVPVDFSASSRAALDAALEIARRSEAEITVLHVWRPPEFAGADLMVLAHSENISVGELGRREAERQMQRFLQNVAAGIELRREIAIGDPRHVILERAAEFDLIAMGTHGRSGAARLLLGSVAEAVVRRASCPVLTVHA